MNWIARLVQRLYPAWWRRRYGSKLRTLVEDTGPTWRTVLDVGMGGRTAQQVAAELARLFIEANLQVTEREGGASERYLIQGPPRQGRTGATALTVTTLGMGASVLAWLAVAAWRRRTQPR